MRRCGCCPGFPKGGRSRDKKEARCVSFPPSFPCCESALKERERNWGRRGKGDGRETQKPDCAAALLVRLAATAWSRGEGAEPPMQERSDGRPANLSAAGSRRVLRAEDVGGAGGGANPEAWRKGPVLAAWGGSAPTPRAERRGARLARAVVKRAVVVLLDGNRGAG